MSLPWIEALVAVNRDIVACEWRSHDQGASIAQRAGEGQDAAQDGMPDPIAFCARRMAVLSEKIAGAEIRSTAATEALTALIDTDADTTQAEQDFNEAMDALSDFRRQLAEILLTLSS